MSNNVQNEVGSTAKLPMMLSHLTACHLFQNYMADEELFENATFSVDRKINIDSNGIPLHSALSKTPPTTCGTPGKQTPGGYTPSGKWKSPGYTPSKTDKRAGQ